MANESLTCLTLLTELPIHACVSKETAVENGMMAREPLTLLTLPADTLARIVYFVLDDEYGDDAKDLAGNREVNAFSGPQVLWDIPHQLALFHTCRAFYQNAEKVLAGTTLELAGSTMTALHRLGSLPPSVKIGLRSLRIDLERTDYLANVMHGYIGPDSARTRTFSVPHPAKSNFRDCKGLVMVCLHKKFDPYDYKGPFIKSSTPFGSCAALYLNAMSNNSAIFAENHGAWTSILDYLQICLSRWHPFCTHITESLDTMKSIVLEISFYDRGGKDLMDHASGKAAALAFYDFARTMCMVPEAALETCWAPERQAVCAKLDCDIFRGVCTNLQISEADLVRTV